MGDPAGVGPEICLRALASAEIREIATAVVFGDAAVLRHCAAVTGLPEPRCIVREARWSQNFASLNEPAVLDLPGFNATDFNPGTVSGSTGAAAYRYIQKSITAAVDLEVQAVVTAPINKEALRAAGIDFPGHTEIFASATRARRACMFQFSKEVCASFVTVHVGYSEVPALISTDRILDVIELTAAALQRIHGRPPRLAVLGLNPHAGEHGLFGNREEERFIIPAIQTARQRGYEIEGPLPPDTAFIPAKRRVIDGFICMYHDQGHIPLKALAFDSAVNTTLGLPIVRTSVDHGTACDIAWQAKADPGSLFAAIKLAAKLSAS
ncbi:4-hydroxythreonine-4-phosphate dehydrogenase PdxA [Phragmitibacter flavus]|uniref:4-hydroxythreonine-4-phosphate dehydrogenase PdxA n=2 Tax=Phragmitibacter flavus TaxID=2576071 RepID=A0A5R8KKL5_9BACT|nr:4-hydroxythreonine-4-phosphate dehydrogenase PdxA [Phragmitibacter flavus]